MQDRPWEDQAPQEATEHDPAAEFLEGWCKIRKAQGRTKDAAAAELTIAGEALMRAINADKKTGGTS
jgi:hypothetical protein